MTHTAEPWVLRLFPTARMAGNAWWIMDSIPDEGGKVVANAVCQVVATNDDAEANARRITDCVNACERGRLWSFIREVIERGASIEQEVQRKGEGYEAYSARIDAAARYFADKFLEGK